MIFFRGMAYEHTSVLEADRLIEMSEQISLNEKDASQGS